MIKNLTGARVAALAIALLFGWGAGAQAATPEGKCSASLIKEAGKYVKARTKTLTKCNDSQLKAKAGFNGLQGGLCRSNDGKTQEKLDKAEAKFQAAVDKQCGGSGKSCQDGDALDLDDLAIGWGPGGGFGGNCPGFEDVDSCAFVIDDCGGVSSSGSGVSDCLLCINDAAVNQAMDLVYGDLDPTNFGAADDPEKTRNKCQQALVKSSAKFLLAKSKIRGKCWASLDKGKAGFSSSDELGCIDASGKTDAKIAKAESKKIAGICKKCGGPGKACAETMGPATALVLGDSLADDLDPQTEIGFGLTCPDVTLPYVPNTNCGTLDDLTSGTAADVIDSSEELVRCIDCVLEFKVDCIDRATAPHREAFPDECTVLAKAQAFEITDPSDLIGGKLARGQTGDYMIRNGKIRVIIQKAGRNFSGSVGQYGGNPIDADLVRAPGDPGNDLFEEWAFLINTENTANHTSVIVVNDGTNGNPAVIRATGPDDLLDRINPSSVVADFGLPFPAPLDDTDQPVEVSTDYILDRGTDALRIETTVTNTSGAAIDLFLGDFLAGLGQEVFHPGYGYGEPLATTACGVGAASPCDFWAYAGEGEKGGVSYGYIQTTPGSTTFNTTGVQISLLGANAVLALVGVQTPNFTIDPAASVTVTRHMAIGDGDVASVLDIRNQLTGLDVGTVSGQVTVGGVGTEGVEISVLSQDPAEGPGTTVNVVSQFRTDANGDYEGTLPVGDYELTAHKEGHLFGAPSAVPLVMTSGASLVQNFTIAPPATLNVDVVDHNAAPIGARVTLVGFDPSVDPGNSQLVLGLVQNDTAVFGDITKDPFPYGIASIHHVDPSGSISISLEPGDYRAVVSHGTEYSADSFDFTAVSGVATNLSATVAEVIDTTGFVSMDMHVHSFDSPDSAVTRRERILSMIAEGIDFFTPTEHEVRADFSGDIADLGVGALISVAPGNEITPFDYGHFGAFPVTVDPNLPNGGAIDWGRAAPAGMDFPVYGAFGLTPGEIYDAVALDPGTETMTINHVASFFDGGLRFDTGIAPPKSFGDPTDFRLDPSVLNFWDDDFTALEIWIATSRGQIFDSFLGENTGNWFNLLNQGRVRTGTASSDTHTLYSVFSGFPRTYVPAVTDDPSLLGGIAEDLAIDLNSGRAIGSAGPFLRVSVEGDPNEVGGLGLSEDTLVKAIGTSATITVEIQSPDWAPFDTVEYYVNSAPIPDTTGRAGLPPLYRSCPDVIQTDGVDFSVTSVAVNGATRLEATSTLALTGLLEDTWVVAIVRGTDGVSCPMFPVVPHSLSAAANPTLADLKTCTLGAGELGIPAMAFANPVFVDVDGNGVFDPPGLAFGVSCP